MSPAVSISIDASGYLRALDIVPKKLATELRKALGSFGRAYVRTLTRKRLSGRPGLRRVTGRLANSVSSAVVGQTAEEQRLMIVIGAPYARVHENGGTITRRASWVAAHVRTSRGVPQEVKAHARRSHQATYEPRLKAMDTLLSMRPELADKVNAAIKAALESADAESE